MNENTATVTEAEARLVAEAEQEIKELKTVEKQLGDYVSLMRISCVLCGQNPSISCHINTNNMRLFFCSFKCLFEWDKRFPEHRNKAASHTFNNNKGGGH